MDELNPAELVQDLRDVFATGKTKSAQWRVEQLKGLVRLTKESADQISEALKKDLNKSFMQSFVEINNVRDGAELAAKNVQKWMLPEKVSTPLTVKPSEAVIMPEPLGVAFVIAPWNFPFSLSLEPVIGAIAAGNVVVLKPSELAPATSALLAKLVPLYLDPTAVRVVEGGVPETTALLEQKWDKIFYTGGTRVGKIVMAAAAKHLTPVTLELGGKSPTIVDSTADLNIAAKRICWGKWNMNNGQACIAPDYILAEESVVPKLVEEIKGTLKEFYGGDPSTSSDLTRIINDSHYKRLSGLLNDERTKERIVHGGQENKRTLYIEPTLILDPPLDSPIMQDEIFGPLLVVMTVKDVDEAVKVVNSQPKPLALYLFTSDKQVMEQVICGTSSGGVTVNDTVFHIAVSSLPFGGVGDSGMGSYHGKHSFDAFSHKKSVLYRTWKGESSLRYPPYTPEKVKLLKYIMVGDFIGAILTFIGDHMKRWLRTPQIFGKTD